MKLLTLLSILALGTTAAIAADDAKPKHDPAEMMKSLDTDKDGSISLEEYKASPKAKKDPAKAEENFKKHDKNGDGKLSVDELAGGKKAK